VVYIAETLSLGKLNAFIKKKNKFLYYKCVLVVLYKKIQRAGLTFILTIIAVAVSAMKRRGGMGTNLAIGCIGFAFVFF
jgi:lipopolysaccharide export system permease protein